MKAAFSDNIKDLTDLQVSVEKMTETCNNVITKEANRSFRSKRNDIESRENELNAKRLELDISRESFKKLAFSFYYQEELMIAKYFDIEKSLKEDKEKFEEILENKLNETEYFKNLSEDRKDQICSRRFFNVKEKEFVNMLYSRVLIENFIDQLHQGIQDNNNVCNDLKVKIEKAFERQQQIKKLKVEIENEAETLKKEKTEYKKNLDSKILELQNKYKEEFDNLDNLKGLIIKRIGELGDEKHNMTNKRDIGIDAPANEINVDSMDHGLEERVVTGNSNRFINDK